MFTDVKYNILEGMRIIIYWIYLDIYSICMLHGYIVYAYIVDARSYRTAPLRPRNLPFFLVRGNPAVFRRLYDGCWITTIHLYSSNTKYIYIILVLVKLIHRPTNEPPRYLTCCVCVYISRDPPLPIVSYLVFVLSIYVSLFSVFKCCLLNFNGSFHF